MTAFVRALLWLPFLAGACTVDGVKPLPGQTPTMDGDIGVAGWNVENFPKRGSTPAILAEQIQALDLEVVALQEITDIAAYNELLDRLPGYRGFLSSHTYFTGEFQKLAFLYKEEAVSIEREGLLFEGQGFAFPRPPVTARFTTASGWNFVVITLHLKAGRDEDDRERRAAAMRALRTHADEVVANTDDEVLLIGDFNENVTTQGGRAAFAPLTPDDASFTLVTQPLVDKGAYTFVPSQGFIDHAVASAGIQAELVGVDIPALDRSLPDYERTLSDHLPVVVALRPN